MKTLFARTAGVLVCALAISTLAFAQEPRPAQPGQSRAETARPDTPHPTPAAEPAYVEAKGFATRMFTIVNRDPRQLVRALQLLGSGFKGARMEPSLELKTITVRDFPENIASIEEAIKVLDKPEPPQPTIELRLHMLVASDADVAAGGMTPDLEPVVRQLRSTLRYKGYTLVATVLHRVQSGAFGVLSQGAEDFDGPSSIPNDPRDTETYSFGADNVALAPDAPSEIRVRKVEFRLNAPNSTPIARIQTDVSLRDGEQVVIGTTTLKDKGIVLVLSARVVK
jgi:hypothetical protein